MIMSYIDYLAVEECSYQLNQLEVSITSSN